MKMLVTLFDLQVAMEWDNTIELAAWLEVPVVEIFNVMDFGKEREDWSVERE